MKHVLGPEAAARLDALARSHSLLAFDFDGTLAPIVADREAARMREATRTLLSRLCSLYPCAVISGRDRSDVAARLEGVDASHVVGNHGLEPSEAMHEHRRVAAEATDLVEAALAHREDLDVERKRYSLAVHYRRASDEDEARRTIASAVEGLALPLRTIPGLKVVNLVPGGAPDKGAALLDLMRREGAGAALYVGDDVTDEDAFAVRDRADLVTVRVGARHDSAAEFFVRDQAEVDLLLERLVELRDRPKR